MKTKPVTIRAYLLNHVTNSVEQSFSLLVNSQLVIPVFYWTIYYLPCWQKPATGSHPERDEASLNIPTLL
jgi:hypothetical protein